MSGMKEIDILLLPVYDFHLTTPSPSLLAEGFYLGVSTAPLQFVI